MDAHNNICNNDYTATLVKNIDESIEVNADIIKTVVSSKYLQSDEKCIDDVFNRIFNTLPDLSDRQKALMTDKYFSPAGSILFGLGIDGNITLSNCYFTPIKHDSLEDIFDTMKNIARVFSYRGGSGVDMTVLRPKDTKVNNAARQSSGAVSFMPLFSETTNTIGQNGRRGALIESLDIRHPDSIEFAKSKSDPELVFGKDKLTGKVPDIYNANISFKITNEFMEAVDKDLTWTFKFPELDYITTILTDNVLTISDELQCILTQLIEYQGSDITCDLICDDGTIIPNQVISYSADLAKLIVLDLTSPTSKIIKFKINNNSKYLYNNFWSGDYEYWELVLKQKCEDYSSIPARDMMQIIATSAHKCGDPGIIFIDQIHNNTPGTFIHESLKPKGVNPCFSGDTKVWTIDGPITFAELVSNGVDIPVLTFENGSLCFKMMRNPRITGTATSVIKVAINSHTHGILEFTCTPDHQIFLANGGKCSANELSTGDELHSVYQNSNNCNGIIEIYTKTSLLAVPEDYISCLKTGTSVTGCQVTLDYHTPHVVTSVTTIDEPIDVYNGTVDDTHTFFISLCDDEGVLVKNCGEQPLADFNNCLLGAINLFKYVVNPFSTDPHNPPTFNVELFIDDIHEIVDFMEKCSEYNIDKHPLSEQVAADRFGKRIGIEITALSDMLAALGLDYESEEALSFVSEIMHIKAVNEILSSVKLAKKIGTCDAMSSEHARVNFINCPYIKNLKLSEDVSNLILEHGTRHTAFNTVGPCGSNSIVLGNTSSGIEPIFGFHYTRQTRLSDKSFSFIHPTPLPYIKSGVIPISDITSIDELKTRCNYKEASEISFVNRIHMQSVIQQYTDSSISSTINLPNTATIGDIIDIYMYAWRCKLKGITIFRDGCKVGVLEKIKEVSDKIENETESELIKTIETSFGTQLHHRDVPAVVKSERHKLMWKGSKLYLIVSFDADDNPIEVFTKLPREAGLNDDGSYNAQIWQERTSNWDLVCRLTSMLLRLGLPLIDVIEQYDKSSYSLVDAAGIIKRSLQRYIKTTEDIEHITSADYDCPDCKKSKLIYEGGCKVCKACGYSACG